MGLGDGTSAVLLLGFESATIDRLDILMEKALGYCRENEGTWKQDGVATRSGESGEREGDAGNWRKNFLMAPYLRVRIDNIY